METEHEKLVPYNYGQDMQIQSLQMFRDMASLYREIAEVNFAAGYYPAGVKNVEGVLVIIWRGHEVGLLPQQSLQSIYLVNGVPHIYGDMPKAIIERSGLMEDCKEFEEGTFPNDDYKWVCVAKRRNRSEPRRSEFSISDAKVAKLWGKTSKEGVASPWVLYPKRMLMFRARGYCLRDEFPDVLKGLPIRELMDDDDAMFSRAVPITAKVVEPKITPKRIEPEPEKPRGRSRPKSEPEPTETKAVHPAPKATETDHEPTHGVRGGGAGLFDFPPKTDPEPEPKPSAKSEPSQESAPTPGPVPFHWHVQAKLREANIAEKDFLYLIAYAGLLNDGEKEFDSGSIDSGAFKLEDLDTFQNSQGERIGQSACDQALNDWDAVTKALQQKVWSR